MRPLQFAKSPTKSFPREVSNGRLPSVFCFLGLCTVLLLWVNTILLFSSLYELVKPSKKLFFKKQSPWSTTLMIIGCLCPSRFYFSHIGGGFIFSSVDLKLFFTTFFIIYRFVDIIVGSWITLFKEFIILYAIEIMMMLDIVVVVVRSWEEGFFVESCWVIGFSSFFSSIL